MTEVPRVVYTFTQAAKALGVRRASVLAWVNDGRLATIELDGRVRVSVAELERIQRDGIPKADPSPRRKKPQRRQFDTGDDVRKIDLRDDA